MCFGRCDVAGGGGGGWGSCDPFEEFDDCWQVSCDTWRQSHDCWRRSYDPWEEVCDGWQDSYDTGGSFDDCWRESSGEWGVEQQCRRPAADPRRDGCATVQSPRRQVLVLHGPHRRRGHRRCRGARSLPATLYRCAPRSFRSGRMGVRSGRKASGVG